MRYLITDTLPKGLEIKDAVIQNESGEKEIEIVEENDEEEENKKDIYISAGDSNTTPVLYVRDNIGSNKEAKIILNCRVNAMEAEKDVMSVDAEYIYGPLPLLKNGDFEYSTEKTSSLNLKVNKIEEVDNENIKVEMTANVENNGKIKDGQEINFDINVENIFEESTIIAIKDDLPMGITAKKVMLNDEDVTDNCLRNENSIIVADYTIEGKSKANLKIETIYEEDKAYEEILKNYATIIKSSGDEIKSNEIAFDTVYKEDKEDDKPKDAEYAISGVAWNDNNRDGKRDDDEKFISGIEVKLVDVSSGKYVTNENGEISAITGDNGEYVLKAPKGNYIVVFLYDTSKYSVTKYHEPGVPDNLNSDVLDNKLTINQQIIKAGVTDTIKVTAGDIQNIDLGLTENSIFNLELNKCIKSILVQTRSGVQKYSYNDATLTKVEVNAQEIEGSNVIIEYQIQVTNNGEIPGYVKNIVDYMPNDLTFNSELNRDWYEQDSKLYCNSLVNTKIDVGETKVVSLILTKKMTKDNMGLISNQAEIEDAYNEYGINDVNSTPGNKNAQEDDYGKADAIISIRTGAVVYITLTLVIIAIIGTGVYFINKKVLKKNKN